MGGLSSVGFGQEHKCRRGNGDCSEQFMSVVLPPPVAQGQTGADKLGLRSLRLRKAVVPTEQWFSPCGLQPPGSPQTLRFPRGSAPPFEML